MPYYGGSIRERFGFLEYDQRRSKRRQEQRKVANQIIDKVVPFGWYARKVFERAPNPISGRWAGLTLPGYNYLGPFNTLENGEPTNPSDYAAKKHDKAYAELQKKGINPYFRYNEADEKFLDDIKSNSDYGARVGRFVFGGKRKLTEGYDSFLNPKFLDKRTKFSNKQRRIPKERPEADYEDPEIESQKKIINNMTDEQHFKKVKFLPGPIVGYSKQISGKSFPVQKHQAVLTGVATSLANQYGFSLRPLLTLDTIQRHMFNPRYFQHWMTEAGGNVMGVTKAAINAISGSNVAKGIFQMGANATNATIEAAYQVSQIDIDTAVTNAAPPNTATEIISVYHGVASVEVSATIKLINNYTKPVFVQVYEVTPSNDFQVTTSASTEFFTHLNESVQVSGNNRAWVPGSTSIPFDSAPTSTDYTWLWFSFNRLYKNSKVFKYWNINNKRIIRLDPGEMTSFRVQFKTLKFNVADTVSRLQELGYDSSVLGAASAIVGLDEQIDTNSLDKFVLNGFDKFILYQVKGPVGHVSATDVQGVYAAKVLVQEKVDYKWSIKGMEQCAIPTFTQQFSGAADYLVMDEDHMQV